MDILKRELFADCVYYQMLYLAGVAKLGEFDRLTAVREAKFTALYELIESSGLVDEFEEWKKQQVA